MIARSLTPAGPLAAALLLAIGAATGANAQPFAQPVPPPAPGAAVGYYPASGSQLASTPWKYTGVLLATGASFTFNPVIGGGTVAVDNHLVLSTVALPYDPNQPDAPFTNANYFVPNYSGGQPSAGGPNPSPNLVALAGYVYNADYASLVTNVTVANNGAIVTSPGNFTTNAAFAASFAAYYSPTRMAGSEVLPQVLNVSAPLIDSGVTKMINAYAGFASYNLFTTGGLNSNRVLAMGPGGLVLVTGVIPQNAGTVYPPFLGGALWVKLGKEWRIAGVTIGAYAFSPDDGITNYTGTGCVLIGPSGESFIRQALSVVLNPSTHQPFPNANINSAFRVTLEGQNPKALNIQVVNGGRGITHFDVSADSSWMKATPTAGLAKTAPVVVQVSFNTKSLKAGSYIGFVRISNVSKSNYVQVTLTVKPFIPRPPTGVIASTNVTTWVHVTWLAAKGAIGYDVFRNTTRDSSTATLVGHTAHLYIIDNQALPGQKYFYWVRTVGPTYKSNLSHTAVGLRKRK